ncbi:P-loop containing nucleoside triphosphate hydrolase protein [Coemansia spiralis]|nr:P-loop containing nucleoside triphosphate hydrolase protein [Coemansia spiralis]
MLIKPSSDKYQPISKSSGDNLVLKYFQQRDAKFLYSATKAEHYRHLSEPEITFAGRSNVGKSSLIGAVLRSAGLVKTSKKPGHTSLLNFFSLTSSAHPAAISVVDMPGYGFRSRDEWGQFIIEYLSTRKVLRRVFLLIESKVGELKSTDCSFLELAEKHGVPVQLVLTKTDKLKRTSLDKISNAVVREAKEIGPTVVQPYVIHCSAKTKDGITAVQEEILRVCNVTLGQGAS